MSRSWWRQQGSNLRPSECKSDALPAELCPHAKTGIANLTTRMTSQVEALKKKILAQNKGKMGRKHGRQMTTWRNLAKVE